MNSMFSPIPSSLIYYEALLENSAPFLQVSLDFTWPYLQPWIRSYGLILEMVHKIC